MNILAGVLLIIIILLILYIVLLRYQFKSINRQLYRRLTKHTRQPVSVEFINHQLDELVININNCLKAEENLRLTCIREEKKFKELIADISHDLRTPLTAIKGYLQMLDNSELTKEQQMKLDVAAKYTRELEQLIAHFFEYSYLITTETELKPEKINLTNLVTECLAEEIPSLEEQNLPLCFDEPKTIFVLGDRESILRIIQNLIRNCKQHAREGIDVKLFTENEQAVLTFQNFVSENSELDAEKIFDRFYTGDKARSSSTGLGLSIVKILTEQMGGSVSAALEKGVLRLQVKFPLFCEEL
ncbi:sensor histidine kinase [Anaerocolumna xylanovorans]|uniref:histidine kinase n=1 Tax=Anaerocolumna xylanovorans DSM 12503 TaxID=1121345 RepID=A0A1M7Y9F1_9FIRM|nr:HAMP domain-containing sensor histidine kinase [Anaerocolumna xylanovorans]SHO49196.1 Signal transduction histidine kinase [Anaerocolumna xylanovorans DSM 12503]